MACSRPVQCLSCTGRRRGGRVEEEGGGAGESAEESGVEGGRVVEGIDEEAGEVAGDLIGGEVAGKAGVAAPGGGPSPFSAGVHGSDVGGIVEQAAVATREGAGAAGRAVRLASGAARYGLWVGDCGLEGHWDSSGVQVFR
jgi:hypothetical protein